MERGNTMYLSFFDIIICMFKAISCTTLVVIQGIITYLFYNVGCEYCDILGVPYDFSLTVTSPGMALEVAIILTVIEFALIVWIITKLKKIKIVQSLSDKICKMM